MNEETIKKVMAAMGARGGAARKKNLSREELRHQAQLAGRASGVARRKRKQEKQS
jgi:hypothetical protein